MKKGISLIVLVITIIVMIIIAGAIIISLSQNNIVTQATTARDKANEANARAVIVATWADSAVNNNGVAPSDLDYAAALTAAKLDPNDFVITPSATTGGCPSVALKTTTP